MAVDTAFSIFTWISGYLATPVARRFHYLTKFNENVEMLRKEMQKLGDKRDDVHQEVNAAERTGREIKKQVKTWLRDVDQFLKEAEKLDNEIKSVESHLHGWHADWRLRYKLGKQARRTLKSVLGLQGDGSIDGASVAFPAPPQSVELMSVSLPAPPPGIELMSTTDFMDFPSTKSTMNRVVEALKDENCNIVGLYGMGGVGKTTLVKELGKQVKESKLFDQVVMAVVSQNPDLWKIQGQIADMLGVEFQKESEFGRASQLKERLKNEKSILVILDDIWKRLDLEAVGISHGDDHKGCKIVLTSRQESVSDSMGTQTKKIHVGVLTKEESWDLFRRIVGTDIDSSSLNEVAREVVGRCQGLPLALVLVGRALRGKFVDDWNAAVRQLKNSKAPDVEGVDKDVYLCLQLSYDYLQGEKFKECFLVCCLFPEDFDIPIEFLARYGLGMGCFDDMDTMVEARNEALRIVRRLKSSSLLLDGIAEDCVRMHDVVRVVAISIASEGKHEFFVNAGVGLREWPKRETFKSYTCMSLMKNDIRQFPKGLECPTLQILLLGENNNIEAIPNDFFEDMGMLRVLDISVRWDHSPSLIMPLPLPPSLKSLANLRYLRLENCLLGNISILGTLEKLEIISLYGSHITELPEEIGGLINLRLMDLTRCENLERIPANVLAKLTRLEELYMAGSFDKWEVEGTGEERSNVCLSELTLLPRLTVLCIKLHGVECFPQPFHLPNLQKFNIMIGKTWGDHYPNSKKLSLVSIKGPLSHGVKDLIQRVEYLLQKLQTLEVQLCSGLFTIIPTNLVYCLKKLESITVSSCEKVEVIFQLKDIVAEEERPILLSDLRKMELKFLPKLYAVWAGSTSLVRLHNLTEVTIRSCNRLRYLFPHSVAQSLSQLETLRIEACKELETIIADNEEGASKDTLFQPVAFPNLKDITVTYCKRLRSLFTVAVAPSLQQLQELFLSGNAEMSTIISEGEESAEKDILLPKLWRLELRQMPNLQRLCPESFTMQLPSLKELAFTCPMMCFAIDAAAFGLKSAPNLEKVIINGETLSVTAILDMFKGKVCRMESRKLILGRIEIPLENEVKNLLQLAEDLNVTWLKGDSGDGVVEGPYNILPKVDEEGLNGLKIMEVFFCNGIRFLIDLHQWEPPVVLENLEELHLKDLGNLTTMCNGLLPNGSLQKLRVLKVKGCGRLLNIIPANLVFMVKELEEVYVKDCENAGVIFQLEDSLAGKEPYVILSAPRKLKLEILPHLVAVWDGPSSLVSLHNLRIIELRSCDKLTYLFPPSAAQSISQLGTLSIHDCLQLETIIAEDETETSNGPPIQPVAFPKLKTIQIWGCKRLQSLFTATSAQGLQQLETLDLFDNGHMSTIIRHKEKGEEEGPEKEILLPKLSSLIVGRSRKLKRLCPQSFTMVLPSLKQLCIYMCDMMEDCAVDATAYGLKSAPNLKVVTVNEKSLCGVATQNIFIGRSEKREDIEQREEKEE